MRHNRAKILFNELGVLLDCLRYRAEDDTLLCQRILECSLYRHRIHDGIDGYTRQRHLLLQRNTQLIEGTFEFGIDLVHGVELLLGLGCSVVAYSLKIYLGNCKMCPRRRFECQPMAICLQATLQHPLGLPLLLGDATYDIFGESRLDNLGIDVGHEAIFVVALFEFVYYIS